MIAWVAWVPVVIMTEREREGGARVPLLQRARYCYLSASYDFYIIMIVKNSSLDHYSRNLVAFAVYFCSRYPISFEGPVEPPIFMFFVFCFG